MTEHSDCLAIVMARGGSKRIPRKNARPFCGRPMVAWPVLWARSSGLFRDVSVSTDDPEIARAAQAAGASFYGPRPAALSDDHTGTAQVLGHELLEAQKRTGSLPRYCCCLYGTSALITPQLLTRGLAELRRSGAELLMAVIPYAHPIERALRLDPDGRLEYRQPECTALRTQDIEPSYYDSGLLYWFDPAAFLQRGGESFTMLRKTALVVSDREAVDIDREEDWERAERIATERGLDAKAKPWS